MNKYLVDIPEQMETRRLILRPYRRGDGDMYFAVGQNNREHLRRFEAMNAVLVPRNEEEGEAVIRELIAEWAGRRALFLGAFEKSSGAFAAQIYIGVRSWDTGDFALGYFADREHQGQGYVSEAGRAALALLFETLGARRVTLECSDENSASMRVAERLGFVREGHLRQDRAEADGTFSSTMLYGMLRADWKK